MRKAVALFICFGLLLLAVPNLNAMDKKAQRFDIRQVIKRSVVNLSSMLPFLTPVFGSWESHDYKNNKMSKIRITGGLLAPRVSEED